MDGRILAMAVVCLSLLAGCADQRKPPGLLSKDQMVQAMTELYLAEQKLATIGISRDSTAQVFKEMSPMVFGKLNTNDSILSMSFDYYMARPAEMEEIFAVLIDSLNLREQKMISNEVKQ